jgi:Xaa-Pro aminopeptidase
MSIKIWSAINHSYYSVISVRQSMTAAISTSVPSSSAAVPSGAMLPRDKVAKLRALMREHGLAAYLVPSEDAHQSEYIAKWDARRAFLTGFTGSAGFAIILANEPSASSSLSRFSSSNITGNGPNEGLGAGAALWTDGRYFLQAEQQLDPSVWTLMRAGLPETPKREDWLLSNCDKGSAVGVDPQLISWEDKCKLQEALKDKALVVRAVSDNLVDRVWGRERPPIIFQPIRHLPVEFSGRSASDKLLQLRQHLQSGNYAAMLVTELDEIAWLLNLRGSDVPCNPVFFAFALVTAQAKVTLFVHDVDAHSGALGSVQAELLAPCPKQGDTPSVLFDVRPYGNVYGMLSSLPKLHAKILVSRPCNWAVVEALGGSEAVAVKASPVAHAKAVKNDVELEGFRQCHVRDGAAVVRYLAWLQEQLVRDHRDVNEEQAAAQLERLRSEGRHFVGLSFDTCSASGPNGAIIHYKPEGGASRRIDPGAIYLCDSGAQYFDGTTDITRTVHFGAPTVFERECFTRVLKGVLALERARFPVGTSGIQLDTLARQALWAAGLDYRHGTGHGVGHHLNVHEGPHSISFRRGPSDEPLKAGMTVTDEPGYYHDGSFGIRTENILVVRKSTDCKYDFGGRDNWLAFENITMCPVDVNLIDGTLLTMDEKDFLNAYHARVRCVLLPLLRDTFHDERAERYLLKATEPI